MRHGRDYFSCMLPRDRLLLLRTASREKKKTSLASASREKKSSLFAIQKNEDTKTYNEMEKAKRKKENRRHLRPRAPTTCASLIAARIVCLGRRSKRRQRKQCVSLEKRCGGQPRRTRAAPARATESAARSIACAFSPVTRLAFREWGESSSRAGSLSFSRTRWATRERGKRMIQGAISVSLSGGRGRESAAFFSR